MVTLHYRLLFLALMHGVIKQADFTSKLRFDNSTCKFKRGKNSEPRKWYPRENNTKVVEVWENL